MSKSVPLTYNGKQVGTADLIIDDSGLVMVTAQVDDPEAQAALSGGMASNMSYGFEPGVNFNGIVPGEAAIIHKENR